MANNLGVLNVTLIVQKALERLRTQHPQLFSFARNFSDSSLKKGDTLTVKVPGAMTAAEFDGTSFAAQAATLVDASIAITKHLHSTFKLTEDERAKGAKNFEDDLIQAVVDSIADKIYSDLFGFITTGGATPSILAARQMVKAASAFDRKSVVAMGTMCNKAKLAKSGRFAILDSDYHGELFSDESIVGALINPNAKTAITDGVLPNVHGFAVTEYTELQNIATPHFVAGVFGHSSAFGIVTALPVAPSGNGGKVTVVTDPNTGLSLQVREWSNWDTGEDYFSVQTMIGSKLILPDRAFALCKSAPVTG